MSDAYKVEALRARLADTSMRWSRSHIEGLINQIAELTKQRDEGWNNFYALRKQVAEERYPGMTGAVRAHGTSKQRFYSEGKDVLDRNSPCVVFAEAAFANNAALIAKLLNAYYSAAVETPAEPASDTLRSIIEKYEPLIGTRFRDQHGCEFTFFGVVVTGEDYYYGMSSKTDGMRLLSCVGYLDERGHDYTPIDGPRPSGVSSLTYSPEKPAAQPATEDSCWQPIETAPSGVRVLTLRNAPAGRLVAIAAYETEHTCSGWHLGDGRFITKVTHWAPLPALPALKAEAPRAAFVSQDRFENDDGSEPAPWCAKHPNSATERGCNLCDEIERRAEKTSAEGQS